MRMINANKLHSMPAWTVQRVCSKGDIQGIPPFEKRFADASDRFGKLAAEFRIGLVSVCIKTIVTEHVEVLFWDMDNQFLNEFKSAFYNRDFLVILMALIPVGHIGTIISGDTGLSHGRPSDVADHILHNGVRGAGLRRRSMNIKPVVFGLVEPIGKSLEVG